MCSTLKRHLPCIECMFHRGLSIQLISSGRLGVAALKGQYILKTKRVKSDEHLHGIGIQLSMTQAALKRQ